MIPRRLLRDSGLTLVFNIAGVALSTLAAIMLARTLSLGAFGAYGFAQSVAHVTMVIATMGLPLAASRLVPEFAAKGEHARLRGFVVVGLVIVTAVPLVAALLVAAAATALPDGTVDFVSRHWRDHSGLSEENASGAGWQTAVHNVTVLGSVGFQPAAHPAQVGNLCYFLRSAGFQPAAEQDDCPLERRSSTSGTE
jgi:hypothetical protein